MKIAGKPFRPCIMARFENWPRYPASAHVQSASLDIVNPIGCEHIPRGEARNQRGTHVESILNFLVRDAVAQQASAPAGGEMGLLNLLFPIVLIAAFYFLLIRPQTKRAKEHKQMVDGLKKGDEVVTGGGVLARITEVGENFVQVEIADGVQIKIQKQAVGSLMPKGTYKGTL